MAYNLRVGGRKCWTDQCCRKEKLEISIKDSLRISSGYCFGNEAPLKVFMIRSVNIRFMFQEDNLYRVVQNRPQSCDTKW
jgi:hypothetical protein